MGWIHTHTIRLDDPTTGGDIDIAYLVAEDREDDRITIDHDGGFEGVSTDAAVEVANAILELVENCGSPHGDWYEEAEADRAKLVAERKKPDAKARPPKRSTPTKGSTHE